MVLYFFSNEFTIAWLLSLKYIANKNWLIFLTYFTKLKYIEEN